MGQKTIRCRLIATEESRQAIWQLMAERNTPLINEVLQQIPKHPDFAKWQQRGSLPDSAARVIIDRLKNDPRFSGQPSYHYISAQKQVTYTFKSWLTIQRRKQWKLEGKRLWLEILQSDTKLAELAKCSIDKLHTEAEKILRRVTGQDSFKRLLERYKSERNLLCKCAIAYLLKRNLNIEAEENPEQLEKRHHKTEVRIKRLEIQLQASLPKGRDLLGERQAVALAQSVLAPPEDDQSYEIWRNALTREPAQLPFPILYETSECLQWKRNEHGRLSVSFSGLSEHILKVYCDMPHQHWFNRFFEDQETKRSGSDQHSAGLFTLRSAKLSWRPDPKHVNASAPWNRYYLNLSCTVDTRLWTQEGTQTVIQEKAANTAVKLESMREKSNLSPTQEGYIRRLESTLTKLQIPYPRPSRRPYSGKANILVGVSMGLDKPATVAVVDALTSEVLTYQSTKKLLDDNYRLLRRARTEQNKASHRGHKQRLRGGKNFAQESDISKQVDRLLAKAIVNLAQHYEAGSIVLPNLAYIREIVEAEINARAQSKVPDFVEGQKQYGKAYRTQVHRWGYGRLQEAISSKAGQAGIAIEITQQGSSGN
ncbi:MAG: type V CRISPR-associated protein Cas12k [Leptolyngbyaceae cyanobacterium]